MEIVIYQLANKKYVGFRRVPYGREDTLEKNKEYNLEEVSGSPIGTRKEIKKFMLEKFKEFSGVALIERPWKGTIGKKVRAIELVPIKDL